MRLTQKLMLVLVCCFTLLACNNTPSEQAESTAEEPSAEEAYVLEGVKVTDNEEYGPYTLYKASDFKESSHSQKLEKLVFYEAPEAPANDGDEPHIPDAIAQCYPLGWSEDGKLAYSVYSVGYHEEHVVTHLIRDMHSGDTLWKKEVFYAMVQDTEELYSEIGAETVVQVNGSESGDQLFKYAWLLEEKEVMAAMEKEGIQFQPSGNLMKQDNYEGISFEVDRTSAEEDSETEFTLKSNKFEPKVIYRDFFGEQPEIAGIMKSPSGGTLVVVCSQRQTIHEMSGEVVPVLAGYRMN